MAPPILPENRLKKLIESAIPVESTHFQNAVNNGSGTPENFFSEKSENSERRVEMWLAKEPDILIYKHKGKLMWTPTANCRHGTFKPQEDVENDLKRNDAPHPKVG